MANGCQEVLFARGAGQVRIASSNAKCERIEGNLFLRQKIIVLVRAIKKKKRKAKLLQPNVSAVDERMIKYNIDNIKVKVSGVSRPLSQGCGIRSGIWGGFSYDYNTCTSSINNNK